MAAGLPLTPAASGTRRSRCSTRRRRPAAPCHAAMLAALAPACRAARGADVERLSAVAAPAVDARGADRDLRQPRSSSSAPRPRGDRRGGLAAYDEVVAALRLWHEWFAARVRLARSPSARSATAAAGARPDERAPCTADAGAGSGRRSLERARQHRERAATSGPEGQAWVAAARGRGAARCAGWPASTRPPRPTWSRPGARPCGSSASSATSTSWPGPGHGSPRSSGPPVTPPGRGAGRPGPGGGDALGARRCSTSSRALGIDRRRVARRARRPDRPRERDPGAGRGAAATARSASSCSSAPRPSRSTSPTSSAKLGASGRTEAAAIARRRGLLG